MNIFDKINELGLPKGSYVIVGSSVLTVLGILERHEDVDICVAPEVYAHLKSKGWREEKGVDILVIKRDVYDIGTSFGEWTAKDLLVDATIVNDIPFMNIAKLLQWKRKMGRPKDLGHIQLIERYLQDYTPAPAR